MSKIKLEVKKRIRRLLATLSKAFTRFVVGRYDSYYLSPDVPIAQTINHLNYLKKLADLANHPGYQVLEIGSREVTGNSKARQIFSQADYTGFDYYAGENVGVVGDAHKLSEYFENKFDMIYSSAVFEHLAMPWVVALEISKVLKVGGYVFVETHFSFSSHERPWHFFQFSDMALKSLFSRALGFECIEAGMSNPIVGRFSALSAKYLRYRPVTGLYCHSGYLGRKVREVPNFDWNKVDINKLLGNTRYPTPSKPA